MQIVYLSNRPEILLETLDYVDHLMPFVDRAVVVCPAHQVGAMTRRGRVSTLVMEETLIIADLGASFRATADHQAKNLLLRCALASWDVVDEVFLMSDDDNRPLVEMDEDIFSSDGRYHNYFFHELATWPASATDYDRGQRLTGKVLRDRDLSTRSYSCHMPQLIHKQLWQETVAAFRSEIEEGQPLDEWSLYFNYAVAARPELFHPPQPYRTLCWPALPTDWQLEVQPTDPVFENFYPELYQPGRLFAGLPTAWDGEENPHHAAAKVTRRSAAQKAFDSPGARLLRRLSWLAYRSVQRGDRLLGRGARSVLARFTPRSLQDRLAAVRDQGHDPAFWRRYG